MSVRATDSLIAEIVIASKLPNSPKMIVQSVDAETKMVNTVWFSDANEMQKGTFPAGSLDKAEVVTKPAAKARAKAAAPAARGRTARKK